MRHDPDSHEHHDQGQHQERIQREILDMAVMALGADNIMVIGPVFDRMLADVPWIASYPIVEAFIQAFDYGRFRAATVCSKVHAASVLTG